MKYHYSKIAAGSLLAMTIALAPLASFAKEKEDSQGKNNQDNHGSAVSAVAKAHVSASVASSNWFAELANRFGWGKVFADEKSKGVLAVNQSPVISGITAPTVLKVGQTGTWMVNAFDPQNGSLSYAVDWGDQPKGLLMALASPVFVQTSTFDHTYATAGVHMVKFTVRDSAGFTTSSSVTVRVDAAAATTSAPVITDFAATSTRPMGAKITWKTDINADTSVWYGTSSPLDTKSAPQVTRLGRVKNHVVNLNKLTPDTTYYVIVRSTNRAGDSTFSSETSFVTPPPKVVATAPVITSVSGPNALATNEEGTWTLQAYDQKNGSLSYSVDWGDNGLMARMFAAVSQPVFVQTSTFSHAYANPGTYSVKFTAKNEAGLTTSSTTSVTVTAPLDVTPPTVSGIVLVPTGTSISVDWKTDEAASSKVFYSTTSPVDVTSSSTAFISDSALETDHSMDITGLSTSTPYFLKIQSADAASNSSTSAEVSTSTLSEI